MFTIKRSKDINIIAYLHGETFPEDEQCLREDNLYWVVWQGKDPVGFCTLTLLGESIAFLSRVGVLEKARGKGLHTRLIRVRERYSRRQDIKTMITYTTRYNIASAYNLEKNGYRLYIPENQYVGEEMLYFMKSL